MGYIKDQPWFTSLMDKGDITGKCANCGAVVAEHKAAIDDCYAVYRGRCPACSALNLLDTRMGPRGYLGGTLYLCLPTDHEIRANGWETDVPRRPCECADCGVALSPPAEGDGEEKHEA